MTQHPQPILIALVGATATGKSALAIAAGLRFGLPVVNVDSRLVYCGLDIGTGKPSLAERQGVPHELIDVAQPDETYTASRYETDALQVLEIRFAQKPAALLAGGTGFYLRALEQGLDALPPVPDAIRQTLRDAFQKQGLAPLVEELRKHDPITAAKMDLQNHARVLRALELIRTTGLPLSVLHTGKTQTRNFRLIKLYLDLEPSILAQRIAHRTNFMFQNGLIEETQALLDAGYGAHLPALRSIGYAETIAYLAGKLPYNELHEKVNASTRQYARRQRTWFRAQADLIPFDMNDRNSEAAIMNVIAKELASVL